MYKRTHTSPYGSLESFSILRFYFMCTGVGLDVLLGCLVPRETRHGIISPGIGVTGGGGWPCAWALGIEPASSGKMGSALNH